MTNRRDSYRTLLLQASLEVARPPRQRDAAWDRQPSRPLFGVDCERYRLHLRRVCAAQAQQD
jgi:hypothetical protein